MADDKPDPKKTPANLEQRTCDWLQGTGEEMHALDRRRLRAAVIVGDLRVALNAEPVRRKSEEDFGELPAEVENLKRAAKRIYELIRNVRAAEGGDDVLLSATTIFEWFKAHCPNDEIAIDTVRHMLRDLREVEAIWKRPVIGYVLGKEQPELPFDARQP